MRSLWFKSEYVAPILAGEKRSTVRARSPLHVGDFAAASVGPRTPFATLQIVERADVSLDDVDQNDRSVYERLYPDASSFVRLTFVLLAQCGECSCLVPADLASACCTFNIGRCASAFAPCWKEE